MGFQEFLEDYLKKTVPENKVAMLNSIGNMIDKKDLSFFTTQYRNESDGKVRATIIDVVANSVPEASSPILIEALTDNFIEARKTAVIAIGKIKFLSALRPLLEMLSNPSLEIRDDVIKSIVNIGKLGDVQEI
ncbi:MAG: HEAT repeat domain-containing protein, partial [Promethearchaeota archaeon]